MKTSLKERLKLIRRALKVLLDDDSIAELRVKTKDDRWLVGLFDDLDQMANTATQQNAQVSGIFITLNQLKPSLAGQVTNKLAKTTLAVKDVDIDRRQWLPIDFDPIRTPGTPSTNAEHEAAFAMATECRKWLRSLNWPDPVLIDSGNGAHLLYAIDLPNDQAICDLVKDCLEALALKFSDAQVEVDAGNFNASRVWRLPGTLNCKGKQTEARFYGEVTLLKVPDEITNVRPDLLRKLAAILPVASKDDPASGFDVAGWIKEKNVAVEAEGAWKGTGYKWVFQCPWNPDHRNKSAYIVKFPDGGVAAGCLHKSCEGNNWPEMRVYYEGLSTRSSNTQVPGKLQTSPTGNKSQTNLLLELGSSVDLFHTPDGEPHATVQVATHNETYALSSTGFKQWMRNEYFLRTGEAPRPLALQEAIAQFDATARFGARTEAVALRVASGKNLNYLDLANKQWSAVEFDSDGWRIVQKPEVKFLRPKGMVELPTPVRGGNIAALRKFLNLPRDEDFLLFVCDLLSALLSRGPYPVLAIYGEPGSAKTTMSKVFREMIDPNKSDSRAMPKEARDLAIMANNGWVLVFDNLSYLPPWFSDALCRLSTGGGLSTRALYTDSDEILFDFQRPIVINGIEELATRTDLIDRSVLLDLPVLRNYREEGKFWKEFYAERPGILGALLDIAVKALGNLPLVQLKETPRMADFAVLATAAESALGAQTGAFMSAYTRNRSNANAVVLEASCIAAPIRRLVEKGPWQGTATGLLKKLSDLVDDQIVTRTGWPKVPRVLSGMLRSRAPALRKNGIDITFFKEGDRLISIKNRAEKE